MADERKQESFESTRMTLGEHLDELRSRLFKGVAAVAVAFVFSWLWYDEISTFLWRPHFQAVAMINADRVEHYRELLEDDPSLDAGEYFVGPERTRLVEDKRLSINLIQTAPSESFVFALKTALFVALFIGSPILLWQLWQFIAAGLYRHERRTITRYFPLSLALFVGGVLFGYFLLMPYAMYFFGSIYEIDLVVPQYKVSEYASMLFSLCLALGLVFQLPILQVILARLGLVDAATFGKFRPHFVVLAFIVAAIITPPDPFTQAMMALPMIGLYEVGMLFARWLGKPRSHPAAGPGASNAA